MTVSPAASRWFVLLFVLFTALWFGTLEYRKLIKPDEGRYAEIPREMVASGDWLTPRLNDIKYFEKPALQYWATAAAFEAFGEHDWTARLWPALTGFLCVLLIWFTGRRLFGEPAGFIAAATLASSLLYVFISHVNTLDMSFTFFLDLALCAFLLGQNETRTQAGRRGWRLTVWIALALAVLTKGIVAPVLTGATLVGYSLLNRDFKPWGRLELLRGIPLFLLIGAPWFVAVSLANPEFFHFFFIHEHFERFLTKVHGRFQPWWYFIPVLAAGSLPWTFMALHATLRSWFLEAGGRFAPRRLLFVWIAVVFAFFSVSDSKLASYILPILPAAALLLGDFLARCERKTIFWHLLPVALFAAFALVLSPRVGRLGDADQPGVLLAAYARWLAISAGIWLAGTLAGLWLIRRERRLTAITVVAATALTANLGALLGHENLAPSNSAYQIAMQVKPLLKPGVPFYSVQMYDQTLPYYLDRTVMLVDYQDELAFGLQQEPAKWIPTMSEWERRWQADADAFAVMTRQTYQILAANPAVAMRIVAEDPRRVIVRKP